MGKLQLKERKLPVIVIVLISTFCISWGFKGHRTIAVIAQKHLTAHTAKVLSAYLNGKSMADVSTWADENRDRHTACWHFINLPLGLTHEQFVEVVQRGDNNIYSAMLRTEASLKSPAATTAQKAEALKYLIHLVGDAHQPMHVSRKEDKGGNTIQLRFAGKGTNLHRLWDSKLIDYEQLSETGIVTQCDRATPGEILQWQSDDPMEWIWESYQISSQLYQEVKPGQEIDETSYRKYLLIIHKRINQAGIRLAGELNKIFVRAKSR